MVPAHVHAKVWMERYHHQPPCVVASVYAPSIPSAVHGHDGGPHNAQPAGNRVPPALPCACHLARPASSLLCLPLPPLLQALMAELAASRTCIWADQTLP